MLLQVWRLAAATCQLEADPLPNIALFLTYGLNLQTALLANSPLGSTKAGSVSDLTRATVAEFGSISGEILQRVPNLAEIAAMAPTEVLPRSMSSFQDDPTYDKLRTPV